MIKGPPPRREGETDRAYIDRVYPYDPRAVRHELRGIETLKAEPDRELAEIFFRGWMRRQPKEIYAPREPPPPPPAEETESENWWNK